MTTAKLFWSVKKLLERFVKKKTAYPWKSTLCDQLAYTMPWMLQGLIQSVFELHDGSGIVVTVGKYVTPNHKDINGNGIEPDYRRIPGATHIHPFSFVPLMYIMQLTLNFLL